MFIDRDSSFFFIDDKSDGKPNLSSDPIPIPIVKEITELLEITNQTDHSAEIAAAVKNRKHKKKGSKTFCLFGILLLKAYVVK